jgi:putative N6-adenine-specific DNA methylase
VKLIRREPLGSHEHRAEYLRDPIMGSHQTTKRYFAQIAEGLEELGQQELEKLGAVNVKSAYRGRHFEADTATLYRINYLARFTSRILAQMLRFDCHSTKYLYKTASGLRWSELLSPDKSFAVSANVSNSRIRHSQYAALCLKDAIVDYFREQCGKRPRIEKVDPDLWLNLHIEHNRATSYVDTSGGSLHRRGYRRETVEAPMQETLAAAVIRLSGWDGSVPLVDPMCGSGTLLCEALMQYCRIPAGFLRKRFGFEQLPDFDPGIWKKVKDEADRCIRELPKGLIRGNDLSAKNVAVARGNSRLLPYSDRIRFTVGSFKELADLEGVILVCNPPHGVRLKRADEMADFLKGVGDFLKQHCKGSTAYLYLGDRQQVKTVGLRAAWKKPLMGGGLEGVLVKYELY